MTTKAITPLRQRMIEDMTARKLCAGTQRGHIRACKRFAAFLKRSPDASTLEDIRWFQLHLAETGVSICTRNRIMTGLRFLFRVTLRAAIPSPAQFENRFARGVTSAVTFRRAGRRRNFVPRRLSARAASARN